MVVLTAVSYAAMEMRWSLSAITYNEEMLQLLSCDGYGIVLTLPQYFYIVVDIAWASMFVGMFFFVKPSRYLFILLVLFATTMSLFWGVRVTSPISTFALEVLNLLGGGTLVYSCFGIVGQRFMGTENAGSQKWKAINARSYCSLTI